MPQLNAFSLKEIIKDAAKEVGQTEAEKLVAYGAYAKMRYRNVIAALRKNAEQSKKQGVEFGNLIEASFLEGAISVLTDLEIVLSELGKEEHESMGNGRGERNSSGKPDRNSGGSKARRRDDG